MCNKKQKMEIRIENRKISVEEYQSTRKTTGWAMLDDVVVSKGLENDLHSVCIFDSNKLIGIGRVVGDGAIYFYIQDIIVIPEYKGKGIGKLIMNNIETYLINNTNNNSFVGLMAAEGVHAFYYKFGYAERAESKPGMFKMIKNKFLLRVLSNKKTCIYK